MVEVEFTKYVCDSDGCTGTLEADGLEYGLFRKSNQVAFGIDLLYGLDSSLGYSFPTFYGAFKTVLNRDANLPKLYSLDKAGHAEVKEKLRTKHLQDFQDSFFDFLQLQQTDYSASFTCPHAMSDDLAVVIDGITLGYKSERSSISCAVAAHASAPYTYGSKFENRVFLTNSKQRAVLYTLGEATELAKDVFCELTAHIQHRGKPHETALLPFLHACAQTDTMRVVPNRALSTLFKALGSSAPVSQIAKPCAWLVLQKVVDSCPLALKDLEHLSKTSPSLYPVLHTYHSGGVPYPEEVRYILKQLAHMCLYCISNVAMAFENREHDHVLV